MGTTSNLTELCSDPKLAAIWLSALIDGEGCVWVGQLKNGPSKGETRRTITIGMTDCEIVDFACACLVTLGVRFSRHFKKETSTRKAVYTVSVSALPGIKRLSEVLTLIHDGKKRRLILAVESFKPASCGRCGVAYHQRTRGCSACVARMKYRRKHNLANTSGRTGRLARCEEHVL